MSNSLKKPIEETETDPKEPIACLFPAYAPYGGGSERDYALVQIDTLLGETNGLQTAGGYLSLKHINAPVPELFSEIFPEQASTEDSGQKMLSKLSISGRNTRAE